MEGMIIAEVLMSSTLDLLGVLLGLLRLLGLRRDQFLHVLHLMLQVCGLSLTRL
jgi:hypothetical protein